MKGFEKFEKGIIETLKYSHGISLNANDFFWYATACEVLLMCEDFHWAMPIIEKHGQAGVDAVMSKIANLQPIKPHVTDEFKQALEEINSMEINVLSDF